MTNHEHIQVLVQRVDGVGPGWIGRAGKNIWFAANPDNVWRMSSAGAFGMIAVYSASFDRRDGRIHETRFVECVGMDGCLDIMFVGDAEAAINGGWSPTPVFVELEADGSSGDLLGQTGGQRGIAFAGEAKIKR